MNHSSFPLMKRLLVFIGVVGFLAYFVMHYQKQVPTVKSNIEFILKTNDTKEIVGEKIKSYGKNSLDIDKNNMKNEFPDETNEFIRKKDLPASFRLSGCLPYRNIIEEASIDVFI